MIAGLALLTGALGVMIASMLFLLATLEDWRIHVRNND